MYLQINSVLFNTFDGDRIADRYFMVVVDQS